MGERNWREAKIPQWVKDAIDAEMKAVALRAALSWPTEVKPDPLPFWWGDYDVMCGEGHTDGTYWCVYGGSAFKLHIKKQQKSKLYREWMFSRDGENWTTYVQRGKLYLTKRDAELVVLWDKCTDFASQLLKLRSAP